MIAGKCDLTGGFFLRIERKSLLMGKGSHPAVIQRPFQAQQRPFLGNHPPFLAIQSQFLAQQSQFLAQQSQ